jgi:hypothetical protein
MISAAKSMLTGSVFAESVTRNPSKSEFPESGKWLTGCELNQNETIVAQKMLSKHTVGVAESLFLFADTSSSTRKLSW